MIKQRNLLKTPSFIKIQLSLVSLSYPKKKKKQKTFLNHHRFLFLSLWLILHKIAVKKKNLQRNLQIMNSNTIKKKKKKKLTS